MLGENQKQLSKEKKKELLTDVLILFAKKAGPLIVMCITTMLCQLSVNKSSPTLSDLKQNYLFPPSPIA